MTHNEMISHVVDQGLAGGRGMIEFASLPYGHPTLTHKARPMSGLGYEYATMSMMVQPTTSTQQSVRRVMVGGGGGYGKQPQPFFIPVKQPPPCACPTGMSYDRVRGNEPPVLYWPTEGSTGKSGKELNDIRQASVNDFKNKCATWVSSKCYDPAMKNIRERLQRQNERDNVASGPQASASWRNSQGLMSRIMNNLTRAQQMQFVAYLRSRGMA